MIISASRRTDIPAFYGKWFINRLKAGEVEVRNPFNYNQISKYLLTPENVECIVFWTKNPDNFFQYLNQIDELNINYYFLFSLNPYGVDYEANLPDKSDLVRIFGKLSSLIGPERVIWRYDPIIIDNNYSPSYHIENFEKLCSQMSGYTSLCITSFITMYNKCKRNLINHKIIDLDYNPQAELLKKLQSSAKKYNIELTICTSENSFEEIGVRHAKCIDDNLIQQITGKAIKFNKDKNQRPNCNCIKSVDIGAYNTCFHKCKYCYANNSFSTVDKNVKLHNPNSTMIIG